MRTALRIAALLAAVVIIALWFFGGPNLGWTKNQVTRFVKDPVTGIDGPVSERRFVPGVDFLGGGLLAAGMVGAISFLFPKPPGRRGG